MRALPLTVALTLPLPALPQTVTTTNVDSIRNPTTWVSAKKVASVSPLRLSATGSLEAVAGQRVPLAVDITQSSVSVTFPGQKTTAMTVAGLRLHYENTGKGWKDTGAIDVTLAQPSVAPPGSKLTCRYDMPVIGAGSIACAPGTVVAAPTPPAPTASPNGTVIPPATLIVAADGGQWALGPVVSGKQREILLNGKRVGTHAETLTKSAKGIFAWNGNNGFSMWNGTTWVGGTP